MNNTLAIMEELSKKHKEDLIKLKKAITDTNERKMKIESNLPIAEEEKLKQAEDIRIEKEKMEEMIEILKATIKSEEEKQISLKEEAMQKGLIVNDKTEQSIASDASSLMKDNFYKELSSIVFELNYCRGRYAEFKTLQENWEDQLDLEEECKEISSMLKRLAKFEQKQSEESRYIRRLKRSKRNLKKTLQKWITEQNTLANLFKPQSQLGDLLEIWLADMETLLKEKDQLDAIRDDPSTPDQLREARKVISEIEKGRIAITTQIKATDSTRLELLSELEKAKELIRNINLKDEMPSSLERSDSIQPVQSSSSSHSGSDNNEKKAEKTLSPRKQTLT